MCGDGNHLGIHAAELLDERRRERAADRSRLYNTAEQLFGQSKFFNQLPRPVARLRVEKLACGGNGVLRLLIARQKIIQKVGNKQHIRGDVEKLRRVLLNRQQLIKRVQLQYLNARDAVNLVGGYLFRRVFGDPRRARVPIMHGI